MSKDFPALRMTIEGGRLVPATPFDAERINSYRRGTVVFVKFTEERDRILIRKWFAILGLVLKQCQTPWKNKDEAHEAIKLALGIVNLSKTVSGQFMQYPKSLSELDDPELQEALEQMTELLSRMTGVDVATLRKEAADVGQAIADEEQANTDDAARLPASTEGTGGDDLPASTSSVPSTLTNHLMDFARKGFKTLSDDIDDDAKTTALDMMVGGYQALIDTGDITAEDWPKFESIVTAFKAVFAGKRTVQQGREFAAEVIGCKINQIGG
jgi:hypothetical protein